jgi:hypothetical protein
MEAGAVLASRLRPILRGSPLRGERLRMTAKFFVATVDSINFKACTPLFTNL